MNGGPQHRSAGGLPWPAGRRDVDPLSGFDPYGLFVFVPAIMSVGIVFSLFTLLRDLLSWGGKRTRRRRTSIAVDATLDALLGDLDEARRGSHPVAPKRTHLVAGVLFGAAAVALTFAGLVGYFAEPGSVPTVGDRRVADVAWLLAIWLTGAGVFSWLAVVSLALWRRWPDLPWWTASTVRAIPMSPQAHAGQRPSGLLTASMAVSAALLVALSGVIRSDLEVVRTLDRDVLDWFIDADWAGQLSGLDAFGSTVFSIGFVVLIGFSAFRCRVMALVYPAAFVTAWSATTLLQDFVERLRPTGFGQDASYPSGHMVQAVFLAGLVPTAIGVLVNARRPVIRTLEGVTALLVLATGAYRLHRQDHWPMDAVGGVLLGLLVVLAAHWVLAHKWWHQGCSSCPWSPHPGHVPWGQGIVTLRPKTLRRLRILGPAGAMVAAALLGVATVTIGVPSSPRGDGLRSFMAEPAQIGLTILMAGAGLVAVRYRAAGAFLMAVCAGGLGLLASVEYRPTLSFVLAGVLIVPAVITWLAWQQQETMGAIAMLATVTVSTLTGTAFGSREIYRHYYGPTHPASTAAPLVSAADWLWLGGVSDTAATVVAGGLPSGTSQVLSYWEVNSGSSSVEQEVTAQSDQYGLTRFALVGLRPATRYAYRVEPGETTSDDGAGTRGDATFTTFGTGAQNLTIVAASCARNESNGSVFDRILADDPDLFLMLGDLHYADVVSDVPADHLAEYERALTQPAQAALYSQVPTAYVWDDHDFGGNDSDRSSPSRSAVSTAYRAAVPDYAVDPDPETSIAQAFTIGRVRIILTDTRSQRSAESMLGEAQLAWFLSELETSARTHALVIWANPDPWIAPEDPMADDWGAYPEERRRIADAIAAAGIDNLVMVSGDAHMVALDDGTNSGFSTNGYPGFPVLHAAPLDRPARVKGGPYSNGAYPGTGQYGRLEILDDGGEVVHVRLSGHNWRGDELVTFDVDFPVGADVG